MYMIYDVMLNYGILDKNSKIMSLIFIKIIIKYTETSQNKIYLLTRMVFQEKEVYYILSSAYLEMKEYVYIFIMMEYLYL